MYTILDIFDNASNKKVRHFIKSILLKGHIYGHHYLMISDVAFEYNPKDNNWYCIKNRYPGKFSPMTDEHMEAFMSLCNVINKI